MNDILGVCIIIVALALLVGLYNLTRYSPGFDRDAQTMRLLRLLVKQSPKATPDQLLIMAKLAHDMMSLAIDDGGMDNLKRRIEELSRPLLVQAKAQSQ